MICAASEGLAKPGLAVSRDGLRHVPLALPLVLSSLVFYCYNPLIKDGAGGSTSGVVHIYDAGTADAMWSHADSR